MPKQQPRHRGVSKLELPLVVELEQHGTVRVFVLDVQEVHGGVLRRVAAIFTHVQFHAPLLIAEGKVVPVNLSLVRLEAAALGEGLAAVTPERFDTCGKDT